MYAKMSMFWKTNIAPNEKQKQKQKQKQNRYKDVIMSPLLF